MNVLTAIPDEIGRQSARPASFLLVDDDEIDRMSFRRAFRKRKILNEIVEAEDGVQALDIMLGRNGESRISRPYILVVDINMPRMNGLELIEAIRQHGELRDTIVFVLSTSQADEDRCAAYANNIAGYIIKSGIESSLESMVMLLDNYWRVVELP